MDIYTISFDKRMARVSGVSSATRHNRGRDNQGDMDRQRHRVSRAPTEVYAAGDTSDHDGLHPFTLVL